LRKGNRFVILPNAVRLIGPIRNTHHPGQRFYAFVLLTEISSHRESNGEPLLTSPDQITVMIPEETMRNIAVAFMQKDMARADMSSLPELIIDVEGWSLDGP
jgi:hypothetical protein